MRVLFVNHTSEVSGAERSLLTLITALGSSVEANLACPAGDLTRRRQGSVFRWSRCAGIGGGPRPGLASARAVADLLYDAFQISAFVASA